MNQRPFLCQCCGSDRMTFLIKRLDKFSYFYCQDCKFVICDPLPTSEDISEFYKIYIGGAAEPLRPFPKKKALIERDCELITRDLKKMFPGFDPKKIRFLDAGGGSGFYSHGFARLGYQTDYLEFDEKGAEFARKQYPGEFNIIISDIMNYEAPGKYDLIMSNQAIEHVSNPKAIAQKLSSLLKPNGILIMCTPNQASWETYAMFYHFYNYLRKTSEKKIPIKSFLTFFLKTPWVCCDPPRHMCAFNGKNLRLLLENSGYRRVKILTETVHRSYFSRRGVFIFKFDPQKPFSSIFHIVGNLFPCICAEIINLIDFADMHSNNLVAIAVKGESRVSQ